MLIVYQVSLLDVRRFLLNSNNLRKPKWSKVNLNDNTFIRSTGSWIERNNYPQYYFQDGSKIKDPLYEGTYFNAKNAIKFEEIQKIKDPNTGKYIRIKPIFRRFYFDGFCTAKYEIGFEINPREKINIGLNQLVDSLLNLKIKVRKSKNDIEHGCLRDLKRLIVSQYIYSTTKKEKNDFDRSISWVVSSNPPVFFFEFELNEMSSFEKRSQYYLLSLRDFKFFQKRIKIKNITYELWLCKYERQDKYYFSKLYNPARRVRISILRLHAEKYSFLNLLNLIERKVIKIPTGGKQLDLLQGYFKSMKDRLVFFKKQLNSEFDNYSLFLLLNLENKIGVTNRENIIHELKPILKKYPTLLTSITQYVEYFLVSNNSDSSTQEKKFEEAPPMFLHNLLQNLAEKISNRDSIITIARLSNINTKLITNFDNLSVTNLWRALLFESDKLPYETKKQFINLLILKLNEDSIKSLE